ncbi:hypothetical protein SAMN05216185_111172 [Pseudomonas guariconensis]|uniref:hypothetical protein n=1 Tax=Pseudomonas guariconensis TaxID=1288410 RepID=UPI0008902D1F|nr:hypothetical protein SAMN05216185_111172 [Pseudomonas guariconensis]
MTINLTKLKALAEAAKRDPYDHLAANDYGMSMPPATALEQNAEIERHRMDEAEGWKPEISNRPVGGHTSDELVMHSLDKAEGCKPDLNNNRPEQLTRPRMATHSLDLPAMCDICGKARSTRNHTSCSKIRQQRKNVEWQSYMANVAAKKLQQVLRLRPLR